MRNKSLNNCWIVFKFRTICSPSNAHFKRRQTHVRQFLFESIYSTSISSVCFFFFFGFNLNIRFNCKKNKNLNSFKYSSKLQIRRCLSMHWSFWNWKEALFIVFLLYFLLISACSIFRWGATVNTVNVYFLLPKRKFCISSTSPQDMKL